MDGTNSLQQRQAEYIEGLLRNYGDVFAELTASREHVKRLEGQIRAIQAVISPLKGDVTPAGPQNKI